MPHLGDPINIDTLVAGATDLTMVANYFTGELGEGEQSAISEMFSILAAHASKTLDPGHTVAAFGEYFVGTHDPWTQTYTESLKGEAAAVIGRFCGLCSIYMDEAVEIHDFSTNVVPALEFTPRDIELPEIELGVAQLYPKIAVPLVGKLVTVFGCHLA